MSAYADVIEQAFSEIFGEHFNSDRPFERDQVEAWDSLQHVRLVLLLEEKLNRELSEQDIDSITSYQSTLKLKATDEYPRV